MGTALVLYAALFIYIDLNQDELTFPAPHSFPRTTPASAGIPFEDLHIPVTSDEQIHAWYIPATQPSPKVILFFHGNGYTIEGAIPGEVAALRQTGANLLMADYRGYGSSSPGQANGVRACQDARAALRYLTEIRHVPAGNVIIVGRSIGTGIAAQIAFDNPHLAGLVLLSPFTDLNAAARQADPVMRFIPLELMGQRNTLDILGKIGSIHMPLLLVVGSDDDLTPPWMANTLLARANSPKDLYIVPSGGHNDLWDSGGQALQSKLKSFVARLVPLIANSVPPTSK